MPYMELPNWLSVLCLVISVASFVPQLQLLWQRQDCSGISLPYVLFNLLIATEIFAIDLGILLSSDGTGMFTHWPPKLGDWLTLAQFGAVWALWLLIFITCFVFSLREGCRSGPITLATIYITYLFITFAPLVIESTDYSEYRKWFDAVFLMFHLICVNPVISLLGPAACYVQARAMRAEPEGAGPGALSLAGLAVQSVVFLMVGVGWPWRLYWPAPVFDSRAFLSWLQMVGFVFVDYIIFAVTQATLLYIAIRHNRGFAGGHHPQHAGTEREPLIPGRPEAVV